MIVDHRTYYIQPVRVGDWLALWQRMALPLQMKHLGGFVGMFTCDVGDLNQVVHMWAYDDQGARERQRDAMNADPDWQDFRTAVGESGLIDYQDTKILKPVPFSTLKEVPHPEITIAKPACIIDHRTYTCHGGKLGAFLELWERMALPYQIQYLGGMVGMFTCDVGNDLNQVLHMWKYDDQGDRERRRTAMYEDPGWLEYVGALKESGFIKKMENKILKPVPFSPLK